ncbi:MAG: N-acetyl-gamma-glutamyl-phosphate reductase [Verrucomicrobia bacterium]|nr:N-acetyl-gamma-glutamyl-phosphate reductase [Verrucomicrobiota bacterium]
MAKVKVAIVGASGYTGEELVRLLISHPEVELTCVTSRQQTGQPLAKAFPRYAGRPGVAGLMFTEPKVDDIAAKAQVAFLALPHGVAAEFAAPLLAKGVKVIDLSADFRLKSAEVYKEFYAQEHPAPALLKNAIYGMPEIRRDAIRGAKFIASPGCYPTSIILAAAPALKNKLVKTAGIVANSLSSPSGAGRKAEVDYLFIECHESVRAYGVPKHRHLSEIEQELSLLAGTATTIAFTPTLIPVNRGIHTTVYFETVKPLTQSDAQKVYEDFYRGEPFVRVMEPGRLPDIKNIAGTNFLDVAVRMDPRTQRLIAFSAVDNLVKGAGGQAVQSMNLMFGLPETTGLL